MEKPVVDEEKKLKKFTFCGIDFSPSSLPGFVVLCDTPFDPLGQKLVKQLLVITGKRFQVTPIAHYLASQQLHSLSTENTSNSEKQQQQQQQTSRVPICVNTNIPAIFGEQSGDLSEIKTIGAAIRLRGERGVDRFLSDAFANDENENGICEMIALNIVFDDDDKDDVDHKDD
jgi:hypothetical protein